MLGSGAGSGRGWTPGRRIIVKEEALGMYSAAGTLEAESRHIVRNAVRWKSLPSCKPYSIALDNLPQPLKVVVDLFNKVNRSLRQATIRTPLC
jgi:hypothetical protein